MRTEDERVGPAVRIAAIDAVHTYFEPLGWGRLLLQRWHDYREAKRRAALEGRLSFDFLLMTRSFVSALGNANVAWYEDRELLHDVVSALVNLSRAMDTSLKSRIEELAALVERLDHFGTAAQPAISFHVFALQNELHQRLVVSSYAVSERYRRASLDQAELTERTLRFVFDRFAKAITAAPHNDDVAVQNETKNQLGIAGLA